jgi:hypothetical protein
MVPFAFLAAIEGSSLPSQMHHGHPPSEHRAQVFVAYHDQMTPTMPQELTEVQVPTRSPGAESRAAFGKAGSTFAVMGRPACFPDNTKEAVPDYQASDIPKNCVPAV